jgi:hypothetical protein
MSDTSTELIEMFLLRITAARDFTSGVVAY